MPFTIHIGLPKSGSTLLQQIFKEQTNSNTYLSYILTDTGLYRTSINIDFKINNVTKIFDNKKTLYELLRVLTLLIMIIDHSLALDSSRETKN